jgi:Asp-tRNA(Asn)/Glu-tRNA(Gln) amidotransferase A subunit family amidase
MAVFLLESTHPVRIAFISKAGQNVGNRPSRVGSALRNGLLALGLVALGSSCNVVPTFSRAKAPGNHAFIEYWPPPKDSTALRLAVKDNIDIKGTITSAGSQYYAKTNKPAEKDAACLEIARARGVQIVGKANMSEFAISPSGMNDYYGTPKSPLSVLLPLIPGGSSCGSAMAVATDMADVAFGTDTAGSVRVPAACCGVVGLKTTYGSVSLEGVIPIEPEHLDTVGPLGKDIEHAAMGMDLLEEGFMQKYEAAKAARPTGNTIRVGRLTLDGTDPKIDEAINEALARAGFQVVLLGAEFKKKWEQAMTDGTAIAAAGTWMSHKDYRFNSNVSNRSKAVILIGQLNYMSGYDKAVTHLPDWQKSLREMFLKVDFIALPTLQTTPPPMGGTLLEGKMLKLQNTVAVNYAGNPALAMPIPLHHRLGVKMTSLELIGPRNSEAQLLNAGRMVEEAVREKEKR